MRHLYHFNWFTDTVAGATVMHDLRSRDLGKEDVAILSCDGVLGSCWTNPSFDARLCSKCRFWKRGAFEGIGSRVKRLTVDELLPVATRDRSDPDDLFDYQTIEDIRSLDYRGVKVGWAALSVFISKTSDVNPSTNEVFRGLFDPILRSAIRLTDVAIYVIEDWKPDLITIFNGRTTDTRPLLDLGKKYDVEVRALENVKEGPHRYRVRVFPNCPPQDREFHRKETLDVWSNTLKSNEEKQAIAARFFLGRRAGEGTRDLRSYIDDQDPDELPQDWDDQRRNIVVFNSSENEVAGVPEAVEGALFGSQTEGLEFILANLPDDGRTWLTLRVHPNLKGVDRDHHTDLYKLEGKDKRITIVPPESAVSTYALMDRASIVIVFNSSTGVEASYWGKPVIALRQPIYAGLDIVYEPKSRKELVRMISSPLEPKLKLGAEKWAFRLMALEEYSQPVSLRYRPRKLALPPERGFHDHLTLLGSRVAFHVAGTLLHHVPISLNHPKTLRDVWSNADLDRVKRSDKQQLGC